MLYLEDYLEVIEHVPQELRDRFTDMREMDLSVQNNVDALEKRQRVFFSQCRRGELQGHEADIENEKIRADYYKILEDSDEKVSLANQMYELLKRYARRLDSELYKFKCELEADNKGITDILEKRALELEGACSTSSVQKENRYFGGIGGANHTTKDIRHHRFQPEKRRLSTNVGSIISDVPKKRPSVVTNNLISVSSAAHVVRAITAPATGHLNILQGTVTSPSVAYSLQNLGAGNAIAAAASQAIAATQQMQQGRRTASLKASYEAINGSGGNPNELVIGRELVGATNSVIQAVEREGSSLNGQRKHKKKLTSSISHNGISASSSNLPSTSHSLPTAPMNQIADGSLESPSTRINENGLVIEQTPDGEWTYDPNEPRYCICNQVSYGDMVACDNEACPFEWFHYPCVGITQSPKGKWYCPKCTTSMRRRGNRKN